MRGYWFVLGRCGLHVPCRKSSHDDTLPTMKIVWNKIDWWWWWYSLFFGMIWVRTKRWGRWPVFAEHRTHKNLLARPASAKNNKLLSANFYITSPRAFQLQERTSCPSKPVLNSRRKMSRNDKVNIFKERCWLIGIQLPEKYKENFDVKALHRSRNVEVLLDFFLLLELLKRVCAKLGKKV